MVGALATATTAWLLLSSFASASSPFHRFSTKTPYWSQQDPGSWSPPPATCTPSLLEVRFFYLQAVIPI